MCKACACSFKANIMGFSRLCVKQKVWPSFVVISTSASDIVGYIPKTIRGQIHWIIWRGERGEEIMLINVLLSNGSSNIYICVWWEFDCVIFPPFIIMSDSHLVGIWLVGICWVTIIVMVWSYCDLLCNHWLDPTEACVESVDNRGRQRLRSSPGTSWW